MSDKQTRGRASKVDLLPEAIKAELIELLRDKSITQKAVLDRVNSLIEGAGLPDDEKLSRAGLNRYATRMTQVGGRIAEAREVSKMWVNQLGNKPTGEVSMVLIEMVRTLAFDSVLQLSEDGKPVEPKFIKELAIGVEKLEKAASESTKREKEIRKTMAEEAAEQAATVAASQGLTKEAVATIKREILGIA